MKKRSLWLAVTAVALSLFLVVGYQNEHELERSTRGLVGNPLDRAEANPTVIQRELAGLAENVNVAQRGPYTLQERVSVPEGSARDVFLQLKPRAESGDAEAALIIYLKLRECHKSLNDQLSEEIIRMYGQMGAAEGLLNDSLAQLKDCEGISPYLADRAIWLERAASAGLEEAQLLYATNPSPIIGEAQDMLRDPGAVRRYKEKAIRYLTTLAAQGNIEAMLGLASAFDDGVLLDHDPARSYAYYKAVENALPGSFSMHFLSTKRQEVPANRRGEADRMARSIYRKCCEG